MAQSPYLVSAVNYLASRKYQVTSQSDQQVQMVKVANKSCLLLGILFFLGIWPVILYLIFEKNKTILVTDLKIALRVSSGAGRIKNVRYADLNAGKYAQLDIGGRSSLPVLIGLGIVTAILGFTILVSLAGTSGYKPTSNEPFDFTKSNYMAVDHKRFFTYYQDFEDKKVTFPCKVFNVNTKNEFQCYIGESFDDIYVKTEQEYSNLFENDTIVVYGIGAGEACGKNRLGGEVCSPLVERAFFEIIQSSN